VNGGGVKIYSSVRRPTIADPGAQLEPVDILLPGVGCQLTIHLHLPNPDERGEFCWKVFNVFSVAPDRPVHISTTDPRVAYPTVADALASYKVEIPGASWATLRVSSWAVQQFLERSRNAAIAFRRELGESPACAPLS